MADHPLLALPGVGPLVTAKLLGEVGDVRRFRSADAIAMLAGVARIESRSLLANVMRAFGLRGDGLGP